MRLLLFLYTLMAVMLFSCRDKAPERIIMTVKGPVSASSFGPALVHEHVLVDWIGADSTGYHRWDRDSVIARTLPYLQEIRELGVKGFVDCSPAYLGRDPYILRSLSELSGLYILTNTGYYGAVNNRFIPAHAREESAEEIARRWINEFEQGIDDSGIKPGFIKIGVKEDCPLSDLHRKLVRAAAITHKQTGLTIKSHTGGDIPALEQIELLKQEGVSPSAFIWTHAQGGSPEKLILAAREGAWISLDGVNISSSDDPEGKGNLDLYLGRLGEMKNAGLLGQVLISHDAGWYDAGEPGGGGYRGYSDIHRYLIPALLEKGFSPEEVEEITTLNPSKAFEVRIRLN